jgi:hypothetical protein
MAIVHLLGRDIEVAPYKLSAMVRAAPIVDQINEWLKTFRDKALDPSTGEPIEGVIKVEELTRAVGLLVSFVAIGLVKVEPALTEEALCEEFGIGDFPVLMTAYLAISRASGMGSSTGEAQAPSGAAEPKAASKTASES